MKLRSKFLFILILIPIILLLGFSFLSYNNRRNLMIEEELRVQEAIAKSTANLISGELNKYSQILINMSRLHSVRTIVKTAVDSLDRKDYTDLESFDSLTQDLQSFMIEGLVDRISMGSALAPAVLADKWRKMPSDFDVRTKNWYSEAVARRDFVLIEPLISNTDGTVITQASYPIIEDGKILGAVALHIDTENFRSRIRSFEKETGFGITVFTRQGTIIYHTKKSEEKMSTSIFTIEDYYNNTVENPENFLNKIKNIEENPTGNVDMNVKGGRGNNRLLSYRQIAGTPWIIAISSSKNALAKSAAAKTLPSVILSFVAMMVLLGSIYILLNYSVLRHIKKTSSAISDISEGEGDLTVKLDIKTKDEIGELALYFNSFVAKLRKLILDIQSSANNSDRIKDELSASAEETSAAIKNIKRNTSSLLQETERMNLNITENVASTEQITANINSIDNQISEQATMMERSISSITEMIGSLENVYNITVKKEESVHQLVSITSEGFKTLTAMADGFKTDVVDKITGISEMASTIQKIASQTNLLSMNAAIEAAHAGDSGKGFAVVADEIRKLADTSSKSSANITKIIKEISAGVSETDLKTKKSAEAFNAINTEIEQTRQAFDEISSSTRELSVNGKQILEAMNILKNATTSIEGASKEVSSGAELVVRSQLNLKDSSDHVTRGMTEISNGAEEIVLTSNEIVKISTELKEIVALLIESTEKFKT